MCSNTTVIIFFFFKKKFLLIILGFKREKKKLVNSCWLIQLSKKRSVVVQDFRGRSLVSIREFYEKDGKLLPTAKGEHISLLSYFTSSSLLLVYVLLCSLCLLLLICSN